jgi:hypothetical protein
MVIWLASYPRSGNTFFRVLLHRLFGFQTYSVYPIANETEHMPDDTQNLMRLTGQVEAGCDVSRLRADSGKHFVKTHDLPSGDSSPAVVLVRDGRDVMVSYARYVLKTEQGIEQPTKDEFEGTLEQIITGDRFAGWSANVQAWMDRAGWDGIIRYENLIQDPVNIAAAALRRLGVNAELNSAAPPSFQTLQTTVPWFFRSGKPGYWRQEMPSRLQELFLERHGAVLLRLGYSERVAQTPAR